MIPDGPRFLARLALRTLLVAAVLAPGLARAADPIFETRAEAAWVYDQSTDTVLMSKNADMPLPPASMSKLMTLNMLFEALRDGRVTLDTRFNVSAKARAMGGSSMFLNETDRPTVEDLIKGIIVQSGNDACVVVAEGLAGTEEAFAQLMNRRARDLGLVNSTFVNSTGWPAANHRMSMEDLGRLSVRLIEEFPEFYGYFAMTEFPYDGRVPSNHQNRNPILRLGIGADGLKTGHTQEAGYGLAGSALQGDRRVTFVISGLGSESARAEEAERIVNWAFRQFVQRTVAQGGARMAEVPVWMGAAEAVDLVLADDLEMLVPALVQGEVEADIRFSSPVRAPVAAGEALGMLTVTLPGMTPRDVPLVAARDVPRGGFVPRLRTAARVLFYKAVGAMDEEGDAVPAEG